MRKQVLTLLTILAVAGSLAIAQTDLAVGISAPFGFVAGKKKLGGTLYAGGQFCNQTPRRELWKALRSGRRTAVRTPNEMVSMPMVRFISLGSGQSASLITGLLE